MIGELHRIKRIDRSMVQHNTKATFVFGDNMVQRGMGGQAGSMRGEFNALGIPTKHAPTMEEAAFFTDLDFESEQVMSWIRRRFNLLEDKLFQGSDVVIPADGVGTGLAQLPTRPPRIYAYIVRRIELLQHISDNA